MPIFNIYYWKLFLNLFFLFFKQFHRIFNVFSN